MIACHFLSCLLVAGSLLPCPTDGQNGYHPILFSAANTSAPGVNTSAPGTAFTITPLTAAGNDENTISANVPLNEINTRAFRRFHRLFPAGTADEYWFKSDQGYQVSFVMKDCRQQAWFDPRGVYLYSLKFYAGMKIPRSAGDLIRKKYADYRIDVVTEITDGEETFYLVKLINPSFVKTLCVSNGAIDVLEDLVNAGAE
jgi:hypothetical protein